MAVPAEGLFSGATLPRLNVAAILLSQKERGGRRERVFVQHPC